MLRALAQGCRSRLSSAAALQQPISGGVSGAPSRGLKETTGLVGLAVDPHARENLMVTSRAVLESVAAKIPKEAQYRENVEATFRIWLKTLEGPGSDQAAEKALGFQLEELTEMAKDELSLVDLMAEGKPWEVPEGHRPKLVSEEWSRETLDAAKK